MSENIDLGVEALQKQSSVWGFEGADARRKLRELGIEHNTAPITELLRSNEVITPADLGMVWLSDTPNAYINCSEIEINGVGVPVPSKRQQELYEAQARYAIASGKSPTGRPLPIARINNKLFTFPGHILRWSAGLGFDTDFPSPEINNPPSNAFSTEDRLYFANPGTLKARGYGEEGVRRQMMLHLMTQLIHYANGIPEVGINFDTCSVRVQLDNTATKSIRDRARAFVYDLSGLSAEGAGSHRVPLNEVFKDVAPDTYDEFMLASSLCRETIIRARNVRTEVTDGAVIGASYFMR